MVKKIIVLLTLTIILFNVGSNCLAIEINSASLKKIGSADYHLKYNNSYIICSIVGYYNENGEFRPAYCMNKDKPGAETTEYTVNINSILENNAVWRVVKNGYPYVSAENLGLSEYDAYVVTKMAIYCVLGQSDINSFSADPTDGTAVHMLDVLNRLVNEGLNGNDTYTKGTINASKIGELENSENSYYQEYSINSSINMKEYLVEAQEFPEGTYISDNEGNIKSTFLTNENFRIYIPKDKFVSDINGKINITGKCQNYPVFCGEAPDSNYQNYAVTYSKYEKEKITINLDIIPNTGVLKILKLDSENNHPIEGIKFELSNEDRSYIGEGITNENGELCFENLYQGKYILKEIDSGEKYILENKEFDINITYNETQEITILNSIKKGKIKVIKKDSKDNSPINDTHFNIVDVETGEIVEKLVTDKNGNATSSDLRIDKDYYIQEIKSANGYILNEEKYYFNVNSEEVIEIKILNEREPEPVPEVRKLPKTGM